MRLDLKTFLSGWEKYFGIPLCLSTIEILQEPMFVNAVKFMIRKYEKTRSLNVALGRGWLATKQVILEENVFVEASANSSNYTVCICSIALALDIPGKPCTWFHTKFWSTLTGCISCDSRNRKFLLYFFILRCIF